MFIGVRKQNYLLQLCFYTFYRIYDLQTVKLKPTWAK